MPKMHQNTFGDKASPGPAGELKRAPRSHSRNRRGPTFKPREGMEREGGREGEEGKKGKGERRKGERDGR